jgi:hypothetical protein
MSEADRRAFVSDPRRAEVAEARAAGTSKKPFNQPTGPPAPLTDEPLDEEDYGPSVLNVRPITSEAAELTLRVHDQPEPFFEHVTAEGHSLGYTTLERLVPQGDDHWLPFSGEQRIVRLPPYSYIFTVGETERSHGLVFLDADPGAVYYKVPEVQYRDRYWGLNRMADSGEFIRWLNYNPAPMISLANFYEGAIMGDAIQDPTLAHLAGQLAVSFIPVVDQIADARDTIISLWTVASTRGAEGKAMLAANIAAWVPLADVVSLLPKLSNKLKRGDIVTAIARQEDGILGALVRRGDEVVAMTDEAEVLVAKNVSKALLSKGLALERKVFCGLA